MTNIWNGQGIVKTKKAEETAFRRKEEDRPLSPDFFT
jgi:hypothetical protein